MLFSVTEASSFSDIFMMLMWGAVFAILLNIVLFIFELIQEYNEEYIITARDVMSRSLYIFFAVVSMVMAPLCSLISNELIDDKFIVTTNEETVAAIESFEYKDTPNGPEYNGFLFENSNLKEDEELDVILKSPMEHIHESVDDTGYITLYTQNREAKFFNIPIRIETYTYRIYLPKEYCKGAGTVKVDL